jgi:hypothetical protein
MATWTPERPQRECGPDPLAGFAAVNRSALENQGPITGGTSVTRPQNKTYSNPLNNLRRSAALTSLDFPHSSYKLKPGSRGRGAASIFFRQQRGYGRRIAAGFGFVRSCGRSCPVLRIPLVWVRSFIRESTPRGRRYSSWVRFFKFANPARLSVRTPVWVRFFTVHFQ